MVSTITGERLRADSTGHGKLIDVRSAAEFAAGHIPGAVNVPMEQVEMRTANIGEGAVVLVCEAGTRAAIVAGWLEARQPVSVLSGGTVAWKKAGLPLVSCVPCRWTLERQVRLGAGLIVLLATLLSLLVNAKWIYLAMFVGAGLTFAGATNICGMGILLARMPWNRDGKSNTTSVTETGAHCHS
ncbi:MAG: rhodanese-like domain-containing protein [Candidatus Korobacteraceae bacterium]